MRRNCCLSHHRDDGRNSHSGSHRCARHHCDHCRHRITRSPVWGDSLAVTNLVKAQGTASTNDTIARIAALNLGSASHNQF